MLINSFSEEDADQQSYDVYCTPFHVKRTEKRQIEYNIYAVVVKKELR